MNKYKEGDKFILEILDVHAYLFEDENYYSLKQAPYISFSETTLNKFEKIKEEKYRPSELDKFKQEAFEKGLEEAWRIAGLVHNNALDGGWKADKVQGVFGVDYTQVFGTFSAKEAYEIVKEYEESKNFSVGDVVEKDGVRGIVVDVDRFEMCVSVLAGKDSLKLWHRDEVEKTGDHFDMSGLWKILKVNGGYE